MKKRIVVFVITMSLALAAIARAQFGVLTVFDPSVYAEAVTEVSNLVRQYDQLVQTYQMITSQYNQMLWMARMLPDNLATFRAVETPWFLSSATNTYGTSGGWTLGINSGSGVASGYAQAVEPLPVYGSAFANVPAGQQDLLTRNYATVELADGANITGIETVGAMRGNAAEVNSAIRNLENDSLSSDPGMNTEIAVLNKINAASIVALRNSQDTNKLLASVAEQQIVASKRMRDSDARAVRNHVAFMANEQEYLTSQKAGASSAMLAFQMP